MDLSLSESERTLVSEAQRLAQDRLGWEEVRKLGWPVAAIREPYGSGLPLASVGLVVEAFAHSPRRIPMACAMAAGVLIDRGFGLNGGSSLSALADGGHAISMLRIDDVDLPTISRSVLRGPSVVVEGGAEAEWFVGAACVPDNGVHVFVVHASAPEVTVQPVASLDDAATARVEIDGVPLDSVELSAESIGWHALEELSSIIRLLESAKLVGTAQRLLDMTVNHVSTREQFGQPIGSFQAVQSLIADVATAVEGAQLAVRCGLARADSGVATQRAAAIAAMAAGSAAELAAVHGAQLHGGIGFITEHDLHIYFTRAKAAQLRLGTEAHQLELVAKAAIDRREDGWLQCLLP